MCRRDKCRIEPCRCLTEVPSGSERLSTEHLTQFRGVDSLAGKKVAWVRGYDYHKYFDVPLIKYEVNNRKSILRMLKRGRIDYFMDSPNTMARAKDKFYPGDASLVIRNLSKLKLYPAFSNTAKGHMLREIWDQRMPKIHQTTKMKNLFKQWGFDYPFDDPN